MVSRPPTSELGVLRYVPPSPKVGALSIGWKAFVDDTEYVPELVWPSSVMELQKMRTDSQLSGLYRAMTWPIRRFKYLVDPNGAPERTYTEIGEDFGIDIQGQEPRPRGRRRDRFKHGDFNYHALLAGIYGHYHFEQVGTIIDGRWRLRKLAPRPPSTIQYFNVNEDGGLESIVLKFARSRGLAPYQMITLPVDRLVFFLNEKEGGSPVGRSWFRDCYRNWLVKDRLLRVDVINHQRAGGVPWIEAPPGATPAERRELSRMAQEFKVGEESGGAVPNQGKLNIAKVGSGTDVIGSVRYHDDSMARHFLHMFLQLGQTEFGSRALGETFIEYAYLAQRTVGLWYCEVVSEHVFEDWVDWNDGEDAPAPLMTYVVDDEDEYLAVGDLVAMVTAGAITVDPELEDSLRERFRLPARPAGPLPVAARMAAQQQLAYASAHGETGPRILRKMVAHNRWLVRRRRMR